MILAGETTRHIASEVGIDKNTVWTLSKRVRAVVGLIYCACGKIAGHRGWCGPRIARSPNKIKLMTYQWLDFSRVNIIVRARPTYERPEISNEKETEIPLLVNQRNAISLDSRLGEDGHSLYDFFDIGRGQITPADYLMLKEEFESEEGFFKMKDMQAWERFVKTKQSAFAAEIGYR